MIRAFDWRDVSLLKTLADQGVCLDSETGLTQGSHPLQQALLAYLMPMAGPPTYIWRGNGGNGRNGARGSSRGASAGRIAASRGEDASNGDGAGRHDGSLRAAAGSAASGSAVFGQLRHRAGEEHARLLYMAPTTDLASNGWHAVLERLAVEAGERGALNLLAEVSEKSSVFDTLREAGFAIYARQSLWRLDPGVRPGALAASAALRAATRSDVISVHTLYSNVVPRLVQQFEPGPQHIERGYVLESGGELLAYLDIRRGPQGIWVEPVLHPEAYDQSEAVMQACLQVVSGRKEKPLYVCVRRYQHWLEEVVDRVGFAAHGSQAVMVKRLALRLSEPVLKPISVVEGQVATPITSAQFSGYEEDRAHGGQSNGKSAYRWQKHAKTNHR